MPLTTVPGRTRIIFASTISLLAAQCWFIPRYGEPYPAVTMPEFGGTGGFLDGHVTLERYDAVFIVEGREFSFPPEGRACCWPSTFCSHSSSPCSSWDGEPA